MTTTLTCPKCMSEMRSYERNRVLVDQCTGCGGLFLDQGELERLVAAEQEWHAQVPVAAPVPTPTAPQDRPYPERQQDHRHDRDYEDDRDYQGSYHGGQPYRKRKKSFLSELFDD